jgi:hypothetical protein
LTNAHSGESASDGSISLMSIEPAFRRNSTFTFCLVLVTAVVARS